jgi:hypothetical protein
MTTYPARSLEEALRGAAYHEAGHAVVAYFYGCPLGIIGIYLEGGQARGRTKIFPDSKHEPQIAVAGRICAETFDHKQSDVDVAHDEHRLITLLSTDVSPDAEDSVLDDRITATRQQVIDLFKRPDFQDAAKALAEQLIAVRRIRSGRAVEAIIAAHLKRESEQKGEA